MGALDMTKGPPVSAAAISKGPLKHISQGKHLWVVATVCVIYLAVVLLLIQAIATEVRVEPPFNARVKATHNNAFPAGSYNACSEAAGLDQKICEAEKRVVAARDRVKQKQAGRLSHGDTDANLIWQTDEPAAR